MREMRIQVKHQQVGDSIEGWNQESKPRINDVRNASLDSNSSIAHVGPQQPPFPERKRGRTLS